MTGYVPARMLGILIYLSLVMVVGCASPKEDFVIARSLNTITAYEDFLKKHPQSGESIEARRRLNELRELHAWENALRANTVSAYEQFLKENPKSDKSYAARMRLGLFLLEESYVDAQKVGTVDAYEKFLKQYSEHLFLMTPRALEWERVAKIFLEQAKLRESERIWPSISSSDDPAQIETFLRRYSDTPYQEEAETRLAYLKTPTDPTMLERFREAVESADRSPFLKVERGAIIGRIAVKASASFLMYHDLGRVQAEGEAFAKLPSTGEVWQQIDDKKFMLLEFVAGRKAPHAVRGYCKDKTWPIGYMITSSERLTLVVPRELMPCEVELIGLVRGRIKLPAK